MTNSLKKPDNAVTVYKKQCPICTKPSLIADSVIESTDKDAKSALWYKCQCGVMFQKDPHKKTLKDMKFIKAHEKIKEYKDVGVHAAHTYSPIIEELTYGRKILDVGFGTKNNMDYFADRGWIPFGIDSNKDIKETDRIIKDDFETTEKLYVNTYDLVWMSFVLEKFHNPIGALKKAWDVLQEDGVLYISTPDIDFLYTDPGAWGHWNKDENYILWSRRSLIRELQRIGFEIIVQRRNFASRFGYHHDIQIVAQKPYF